MLGRWTSEARGIAAVMRVTQACAWERDVRAAPASPLPKRVTTYTLDTLLVKFEIGAKRLSSGSGSLVGPTIGLRSLKEVGVDDWLFFARRESRLPGQRCDHESVQRREARWCRPMRAQDQGRAARRLRQHRCTYRTSDSTWAASGAATSYRHTSADQAPPKAQDLQGLAAADSASERVQ